MTLNTLYCFISLPETLNYSIIILFCNFCIFLGFLGLAIKGQNLIFFIVFIEIININISFLFLLFSILTSSFLGQYFSFLILTLAAAEAAIAFTLIILVLNTKQSMRFRDFHNLKG